MQGIRRLEQERRVAPIDSRERPRVRPGGRRDQPHLQDPLTQDEQGHRFQEELEAFEQAGAEVRDKAHPVLEPAEETLKMPEDRLELHGRQVVEDEKADVSTQEEGVRHVDVRV